METGKGSEGTMSNLFRNLTRFMRKFVFSVVSVGPMPTHIAFIMDGNRRYAKKKNTKEENGHRAGFLTLLSMLKYCHELGVKYISVYAFSIDNLKRSPERVQYLMDLMLEKIEGLLKEESIVKQYGLRVHFIGKMELLYEPVRVAAEKAMKATANNTKMVLLICVAYTSSNELVHSIQESCEHIDEQCEVKLVDLEKHMYMKIAPDPDILIRSSGETRLSNFLIWQTTNCLLCCPSTLWPELGLWNLVWAILNFQRNYSYLEKKKEAALTCLPLQ